MVNTSFQKWIFIINPVNTDLPAKECFELDTRLHNYTICEEHVKSLTAVSGIRLKQISVI